MAEFLLKGLKIVANRSSPFAPPPPPPPRGDTPPPPPPAGLVGVPLRSRSEPRRDAGKFSPLIEGKFAGEAKGEALGGADAAADAAAVDAGGLAGDGFAGELTTGSMTPEGPTMGVSSSLSPANSSDSSKNSSSL